MQCRCMKLPQMPSCSANNANFDQKKQFDMFYKTDCCAAPPIAEYEWTMYEMKVE